MRIPPGTPSGKVMRVRGQGVAGDARRQARAKGGDLLVTIDVVVPDRARRAPARGGRGAGRARSPTTRARRCSRSSTTGGAPMADTRALYVISVAAELAGVHPQTLRIYERKGLVEPGAHERPQPPLLRPRHRAAAPHPGAHQRGHLAGRACSGSWRSSTSSTPARDRAARLEAQRRRAAARDGRAGRRRAPAVPARDRPAAQPRRVVLARTMTSRATDDRRGSSRWHSTRTSSPARPRRRSAPRRRAGRDAGQHRDRARAPAARAARPARGRRQRRARAHRRRRRARCARRVDEALAELPQVTRRDRPRRAARAGRRSRCSRPPTRNASSSTTSTSRPSTCCSR